MAVISLLGYMGSGKSTYGKLLAKKLNFKFVDLDDYIIEIEKMSISDIFAQKGEKYFRSRETEILDKLFDNDHIIVSLGGGTPVHNDNMKVINKKSVSVYLNASTDTLFKYLAANKSKRPIIKNKSNSELLQFIGNHLDERRAFYEMAKLQLVTDNKSIDGIVDELVELLKEY